MSIMVDKIININKDALFTLMQATKYFQKGGKFVIPAEYYEFLTTELKQIEEENKRLQAENEELKAENERLKEENSKIVWDEVCTTNCSKYKAYNKYRKAIEEIKELINEICWDYTDISIIPVKETMLEFINEVLDERN